MKIGTEIVEGWSLNLKNFGVGLLTPLPSTTNRPIGNILGLETTEPLLLPPKHAKIDQITPLTCMTNISLQSPDRTEIMQPYVTVTVPLTQTGEERL